MFSFLLLNAIADLAVHYGRPLISNKLGYLSGMLAFSIEGTVRQ
jgi:hypothetical protein